ncbi:Uncharacterized protein BP5553_07349 [Venustampulla echinocandica]|uniref:PEBP-like protein n=1 Tax=Venustampulla echinocandica TaxID=2656787 RepID=A0A370TJ91_9HELO|nr:Uncharacterized protein BP5553_07349 [Venustampulla echinocandica]RDL35418.1 Uncharacterized protein BP5553_07349 [Venustampulla echinocandica]
MLTSCLMAVAIASTATAFTPPGAQPVSTKNLTVAFGNTLAINGMNLPRDATGSAPSLGTAEKLTGTYAILMVDLDIPPAMEGGATSQLLHWMQTGLESANTSTTIAGTKVFELVNPSKASPVAAYRQPNPPNRNPVSHRYTQFLVNTTGNTAALASLTQAGATIRNFSAANVIKSAGVDVAAGNWFNVTNANATGAGTNGASQTNSTSQAAAGGAVRMTGNSGAALAGLWLLVAAVAIL